MSAKLTAKQRRFVEAYTGSAFGNATESARRAGYGGSDATVRAIASENLTKPNIKAAIKERLDRVAMTEEEILYRLSEQARATLADFVTIEGPRNWSIDLEQAERLDRLGCLKELNVGADGKITIKLQDQQRALELLGKYHKMWTDKHEHSGPNDGPIPIKHTGNTAEGAAEILDILIEAGAIPALPHQGDDTPAQ